LDDLRKITAEARVGGILSGKCGIVHLHLGDGEHALKFLMEIVKTTEIPISQFMPSHVNRIEHLIEHSMEFIRMGGFVDITSDFYKTKDSPTTYSISDTLKVYKDNKIPLDTICASSDSNGSSPYFDRQGHLLRIGVGSASTLFKDIRDAITNGIVSLEEGISLITAHPAKALKLYPNKGSISEKGDADFVFLDKQLNIDTVIARGKIMVQGGKPIVKGFFEK
jgi:beta-aspartyl-dipeptidase (metallo-type)